MLKVFYTVGLALLVSSVARSAEPPRINCPPKINQTYTVPVQPVKPRLFSRAPIGHTHTCANGHTWDHNVTTGHNCPVSGCGLSQFIQDSTPRVVTGVVPASYSEPTYLTPFATGQSAGCVGGNCPTSQTLARSRGLGIFRR